METKFEISLNMKTHKGIETYGSFKVGNNEQFAKTLYQGLDSDDKISKGSVITIDLIKIENGIPFPLELRHCNYDQLADNIKRITKEMFIHLNLES